MKNKIYLCDLACYQKATEEQLLKLGKRNGFFDLEKLPEALQEEARRFIEERGRTLSVTSIVRETFPYNLLCRFLKEKEATLKSFQEKKEEDLVRELRKWLLSKNYSIIYQGFKRDCNKNRFRECQTIKYLRSIIKFTQPKDCREEREKDIWELKNLDIQIKENPIKNVKRLNFTGITQPKIREEIKEVIFLHLRTSSILTICIEISDIKKFTQYLAEQVPNIQSCTQLDRQIIEDYLIYCRTENKKKLNKSHFIHLKIVLEEVGKITETPKLEELFLPTDQPKVTRKLYKTYSDEEIARLNSHIITMDSQIARALIIHQLLGTRISDTLTLETDCIFKEEEQYIVKIYQPKTNRYYKKPINEEIANLIQKSIEYTKEQYGETKYIFTSSKNINRPFQYSMIQYKIMVMIKEKDLRDDNGELFGFNTHMFRYTYARKLTEMHLDDYTISKLLGHADMNSVKYYRRMGDEALEKETHEMREHMDNILSEIVKGWKEYDKI